MLESKSSDLPLVDAPTHRLRNTGRFTGQRHASCALAFVGGVPQLSIGFFYSLISALGLRASAASLDLGEIGIQNLFFHRGSGCLIQGVRDILECTIFSPLAGHCHEQSGGPANNFEI